MSLTFITTMMYHIVFRPVYTGVTRHIDFLQHGHAPTLSMNLQADYHRRCRWVENETAARAASMEIRRRND